MPPASDSPVPGSTNDVLYFLCGGKAKPSQSSSCSRYIQESTTIRAVAGHMHLLGRSIKIEVNPGTPRARTILDIPIWDFDNQGATQIPPIHLDLYETLKVTCTHKQWLRHPPPRPRLRPRYLARLGPPI